MAGATGSAQFVFGKAQISGTVSTEYSQLSFSVRGQMTVTCNVADTTGQSGYTVAPDSGIVTYVYDKSFSTPKCQPFAALAGK